MVSYTGLFIFWCVFPAVVIFIFCVVSACFNVLFPVCFQPVLMFAGECTHPNFYSSAHGALLSGQREAQRILDLVH